MKSKLIKVITSSRLTYPKNPFDDTKYIRTPKIQIEGNWLESLGFHIGDAIQIAYEEGSIHISLAAPIQFEPAMVCDAEARYASK